MISCGKQLHRTYVGKQSQTFSDSQKTVFRMDLGRRIIISGITHRAEQHGILGFAHLQGIIRQGRTFGIDRHSADQSVGQFKAMSEFFTIGFQNFNSLIQNIRTNTVTG